jgi:hypothetical protein
MSSGDLRVLGSPASPATPVSPVDSIESPRGNLNGHDVQSVGSRRLSDLSEGSGMVDTAQKAQTVAHSTFSYNHNFYAGAAYVPQDVTGVVTATAGTLNTFGVKVEVPGELGLRKYFSVLTGVSNAASGYQVYAEASKTNYVWGKTQGIIKMFRGVVEIAQGAIRGTVQALSLWAANRVSSVSMAQAGLAGDVFAGLMMIAIAVVTITNAVFAGNVQSGLKKCTSNEEKNGYLRSLMTNEADKVHLTSVIGKDLVDKLSSGGILDDKTIEELEKRLGTQCMTNAAVGTICVLAAMATAAGDLLTAGMVSKVLAIVNPLISASFIYFDMQQLESGASSKEPRSKQDIMMQVAMTLLSIALAAATVAGSIGTGGALPIVMLAIGVVMPLITLAISNKQEIKKWFVKAEEKPLVEPSLMQPLLRENSATDTTRRAVSNLEETRQELVPRRSRRFIRGVQPISSSLRRSYGLEAIQAQRVRTTQRPALDIAGLVSGLN